MDMRYTAEQEAWRAEVRDWLEDKMKDVPDSSKAGWFQHEEPTDEGVLVAKRIQKELIKKGWWAITWPKKDGGAGFSTMEQVIFN